MFSVVEIFFRSSNVRKQRNKDKKKKAGNHLSRRGGEEKKSRRYCQIHSVRFSDLVTDADEGLEALGRVVDEVLVQLELVGLEDGHDRRAAKGKVANLLQANEHEGTVRHNAVVEKT